MDKVDILYQAWKNDRLDDTDLADIYSLDAETYDYDNHKHNKEIEEILKSRNIRADLASLLKCTEDVIAFDGENLAPGVKYLYTGLHIINVQTNEVLNGKISDVEKYYSNKEKEISVEPETDNSKSDKVKNKSIMPAYAKRPYRPTIKDISKEQITKLISKPVKYLVVSGAFLLSAAYMIDTYNNDAVLKYIDDNRSIVTEETVRNPKSNTYYYLHNNIAKNILKSDKDTDSLIYVVYREVRSDASRVGGYDENQLYYNMDLIMKDISLNSDEYCYNDFDEYLISKSCLDEQGNVDIRRYDKLMSEYITKMVENNDITFDGGKTK